MSDAYPDVVRSVHHTWVECPLGSQIADEHLWIGTGRKPPCELCAEEVPVPRPFREDAVRGAYRCGPESRLSSVSCQLS
jgi:hypothetical protein